jgi:large subunit ribosomal protein L24
MANKLNIKKGDTVVVIAGKDLGKRGKVVEVYPSARRVLVEKVNIIHKHRRPDRQNRQGGILEKEAPIHISNVMLVDPKTDRGTRVRRMKLANGQNVRVAVRSGEILDKS